MPAADLAMMDFQRAHRFGKVTIDKPRPIVACLSHFKMKLAIMGRGRELKDSPLGLNDQYPKEIMDRWRILVPILKEKRKEKQKVKLVVEKLYVNNKLYKDPTKIDWLWYSCCKAMCGWPALQGLLSPIMAGTSGCTGPRPPSNLRHSSGPPQQSALYHRRRTWPSHSAAKQLNRYEQLHDCNPAADDQLHNLL